MPLVVDVGSIKWTIMSRSSHFCKLWSHSFSDGFTLYWSIYIAPLSLKFLSLYLQKFYPTIYLSSLPPIRRKKDTQVCSPRGKEGEEYCLVTGLGRISTRGEEQLKQTRMQVICFIGSKIKIIHEVTPNLLMEVK